MAGFPNDNFSKTARQNMLIGQLIPNRISDLRLLNAMSNVPREKFLPERLGGRAYADETIRIDDNRLLFSPEILARLLSAAELGENDFVLDVKSGSGYSAAVMAGLTQAVVALENDSSLCETAQQILIEAEIDNVAVINKNPDEGFPSQSPFDVIFMEGIVFHIPERLEEQLAENGRLIAVLSRNGESTGQVVRLVRREGIISRSVLFTLDLSGYSRQTSYKRFVFETVS